MALRAAAERPRRRPGQVLASLWIAAWTVILLSAPAFATDIWLGGIDPFKRQIMQPGAPSDYDDLFRPDAPWPQAARHVAVFQTTTPFIVHASDAELRQMFAGLQRRHIALGVGMPIQTGRGCGMGVEGYEAADLPERLARRIKRLGGDLRYVVMDEPLWFGHDYDGPHACRSSVDAIARDVAAKVAAIRRSFPAVQVGDTEPVASPLQPADWLDQIIAWTAAYKAATGEALGFLQADINWHQPWRPQLLALVPRLREAGVKYGIFYDGDPSDTTGAAWTKHAEERFIAAEADPALVPDQAVFYSWMAHPLFMLPESRPGTMTWLVNRYAAAETWLTLTRTGNWLRGRLTAAGGAGLAGQTVTIAAVDVHDAGPLGEVTLSGTVPQQARWALFALRVNAECDCSGPVEFSVGSLHYSEGRSGRSVTRRFAIAGSRPVPGGVRVVAPAGKPLPLINTQGWNVTPGDRWTVRVQMNAAADSQHSGYIALIFSNGEREFLPLTTTQHAAGSVTTDAAGQFSFLAGPDMRPGNPGFRATFAGSAQYRPSESGVR